MADGCGNGRNWVSEDRMESFDERDRTTRNDRRLLWYLYRTRE
jgi:hypothetical protein